MKRTTISLPDDVALVLEREARRRETSVSAIAREALVEHLGLAGSRARPVPFAALGRSGHTNTSEEIEEILAREWIADFDRDR